MTQPPPPNPVKSAYETFISETPIITRYVMTTYAITFISSIFIPLRGALINIPYFTLFKFEIYRLILSNFVCDSFLSLIFGFISFVDQGKRLEYSIGSTNFALLLLYIGTGANVLFTFISFISYIVGGSYQPQLMYDSGGLWQMVLGIIAMECSYGPEGSKRRLFFIEVPTLYYPFALLALFTLLFAASDNGSILFRLLPYLFSIGLGYAFGFGKLDSLKLSIEQRRKLERGVIRSFTSRPDWVVGPTTDDWIMIAPNGSMNQDESNNTDVESSWSPTFFQRPQEHLAQSKTINSQTGININGGNRLGSTTGNTASGVNVTGGIGMTNRRQNDGGTRQSGREALLAAAERRANEQSNS